MSISCTEPGAPRRPSEITPQAHTSSSASAADGHAAPGRRPAAQAALGPRGHRAAPRRRARRSSPSDVQHDAGDVGRVGRPGDEEERPARRPAPPPARAPVHRPARRTAGAARDVGSRHGSGPTRSRLRDVRDPGRWETGGDEHRDLRPLPDDETTDRGGEGWSEDMELAPAHPGDREPEPRRTTTARASGCRRCWPAPASAPAGSART